VSTRFTVVKRALVSLDDLWCEDLVVKHLLPLRAANPAFAATCYAIPALLGPVHDLKQKYPWLTFGVHGFWHTWAECSAWLQEDCERLVGKALEWGYAPLFKPPNWIMDAETEKGLLKLDVALHCHEEYWPMTGGLKWYSHPLPLLTPHDLLHTHIARNPSTTWIATDAKFTPENIIAYDKFITPLSVVRTMKAQEEFDDAE
jgi:hypothetical protein